MPLDVRAVVALLYELLGEPGILILRFEAVNVHGHGKRHPDGVGDLDFALGGIAVIGATVLPIVIVPS